MTVKKARKTATSKTDIDFEALLARIEAAEARAEAAEKKLESMQDEEARIAEREAALDKQAREMFEQQQRNRRDPNRIRELLAPRDKSVIRKLGRAKKGNPFIRCLTLRKIGLEDGETSDVGEEVDIAKNFAEKLQDAGVVKVKL